MAQISLERHFYDPDAESWNHLQTLHERYAEGSAAGYNNRYAWGNILQLYFPGHYDPSLLDLQPGQTAQGTLYFVHPMSCDYISPLPAERYPAGEFIAVKRTIVDLPADTRHRRDILWVKCGPPSGGQDQPQWTSAMKTAVLYLGLQHPSRALYFILAEGMRWMPFYWDPSNPGPALRMKDDEAKGDEGWYVVDHAVRAPPGVDAGHVDADGVVLTDRAKSLDCFTAAEPVEDGEEPELAFQEDLDFLEEFLGVVAGREYIGEHK